MFPVIARVKTHVIVHYLMNIPCILLVEDNPDDVLLTQCAFEDAAISNPVYVVESAEEAIAYLSGEGQYADRDRFPLPDLLLMDLGLPGKSGHDVLIWIQDRAELDGLVKVVLTGSDDPKNLKRAYELGAHCYLLKPLTANQLTDPGRNIRALFTLTRQLLAEAA